MPKHKTYTEEDKNENAIATLLQAKEKLGEAVELIQIATEGTEAEAKAEAYILPWLQTWMGENGNQIGNITDLIKLLDGNTNPRRQH